MEDTQNSSKAYLKESLRIYILEFEEFSDFDTNYSDLDQIYVFENNSRAEQMEETKIIGPGKTILGAEAAEKENGKKRTEKIEWSQENLRKRMRNSKFVLYTRTSLKSRKRFACNHAVCLYNCTDISEQKS